MPWYQRRVWVTVLLVVFFPAGLFLMWRHMPWALRTKRVITALWIWPAAAWWAFRLGANRWLKGASIVASLLWLLITLGLAGVLDEQEPPPSDGVPAAAVGQVEASSTPPASEATAATSPASVPTATPTDAPATAAAPPSASTDAPVVPGTSPPPTQTPRSVTATATAQPATVTATPTATVVSAPTSPAPPTSSAVATVLSVTDGDTIRVSINGTTEAVRLIGINSPESGECFAAEAGSRLSQLVGGAEVRLERDISDRDQFGRLLRYVYVGGVLINNLLVREGYANAYRYEPDTALASALEASEAQAQNAGVGLWAATACGAATPTEIAVGALHTDAAGNDHENLNDEWIELRNIGTGSADLTGWVVKDETASHRYSFPSGYALGAGATVRLHTGCGTNSTTALFWCNNGAVWNNGGDTVFVLDPSGNIVVSLPY